MFTGTLKRIAVAAIALGLAQSASATIFAEYTTIPDPAPNLDVEVRFVLFSDTSGELAGIDKVEFEFDNTIWAGLAGIDGDPTAPTGWTAFAFDGGGPVPHTFGALNDTFTANDTIVSGFIVDMVFGAGNFTDIGISAFVESNGARSQIGLQQSIAEPAAVALIGIALVGVGVRRRRRLHPRRGR